MFPFSLLGYILALVLIQRSNSIPQSYFGVTSSQYINKIINVPSNRVLKLNFGDCSRQCMLDGSCWSWYVYPNNGTSNCVLVPTNICHQSSVNLSTANLATQLWEKLVDFPIPCSDRGLIANVTATSALSTKTTVTTIPAISSTTMISTITKTSTTIPAISSTTMISTITNTSTTIPAISSTTMISTITNTSTTIPTISSATMTNIIASTSTIETTTLPTCTATQCNRSCRDCPNTGAQTVLGTDIRMCTIWPNGTSGSAVTLFCNNGNPVLLFRDVTYNTSFVNESILTPEEMYMIQEAHKDLSPPIKLEVRFRTVATGTGSSKVSKFSAMPFFNSAGQLSLQSYIEYDSDLFGVPIINAPFMNGTAHPACGPFWDLSTSPFANNGTAFGTSPCPGYRNALYGKPGFYNGTWSSGMAFASKPNDIILAVLMFLW